MSLILSASLLVSDQQPMASGLDQALPSVDFFLNLDWKIGTPAALWQQGELAACGGRGQITSNSLVSNQAVLIQHTAIKSLSPNPFPPELDVRFQIWVA